MEHKNQVILVITVELDNDDIDVIEVHENDEPDTLAINFCKKHNIDRKTQKFLIDKIVENIEELVEDKIKELSH